MVRHLLFVLRGFPGWMPIIDANQIFCALDFSSKQLDPVFSEMLKETRNSSKTQPLDFEKNDSSTLKNVLQNTNEHTCEYLRYVALLNLSTLECCLIFRGIMGVFLYICCIFLEDLFLRTTLDGCFLKLSRRTIL